MKHPVGYAKPRRLATPRKQVQLQLRQRQAPKPEDERETKQKSTFWKWVILVTLFHIVAIGLIYVIYESTPAPPPPEQFISLLPQGDVVKGTPGTQEAHKVGPTTPAPSVHHTSAPPEAVQPPKPVVKPPPTPAKPVIEKADAPTINSDKPITPKPAPVKPKVKVDLTLADGPTPNTVKHVIKPKPHVKKPVVKTTPDEANAPDTASTSSPDSSGLSKEEIAAKLGEKLKQAGIENAMKTGQSGSANAPTRRSAWRSAPANCGPASGSSCGRSQPSWA